MTLLDIERDICRRLDKNATNLDPETKTRLDTFINDRYRELLRLDGINLRDESVVVAQPQNPPNNRLELPESITAVTAITDVTNQRRLTQVTFDWIRRQEVWDTSPGTPQVYAILNQAGIAMQPTVFTANALALDDPLIDDNGLQVTLTFMSVAGSFETGTVSLNKDVPVPFPYGVQYLFEVQCSRAPKGVITIRQTSPSLLIGHFGPNTAHPIHGLRRWVVVVWPIPNGRFEYQVDGARARRELVAAMDEPILPEEFHTMLVWGGCAEECLKMDDNRQEYYERKFQDDVRRLRAFLHHARGQRWIPGGRTRSHGSDLPWSYPQEW